MKIKSTFIFLLAIAALTGCKTTEANYQAAYEAAARHVAQKADANDMTVEGTFRKDYLKPVKLADDDAVTPPATAPFVVAVHQFKQVFNAKALCRRLREAGVKNAYVAQTANDDYYVIADGFQTLDEALKKSVSLESHPLPATGAGFPVVVRNLRP